LFTEDRFIPVLKQVAKTTVSVIEADHISGQKLPHAFRQTLFPRANQEVEMVVEQRPGNNIQESTFTQRSQSGEKVLPVGIDPKDGGLFDPPAHHMV
jgi:hypothetical protein